MKVGKIKNYINGEPYVFVKDHVKTHICCDCGLVHFIHTTKAKGGECVTYWYRDDYETKKQRKCMK